MMFFLPQMGATPVTLYAAVAVIGAMFGANFALFPTTTGTFFGVQHMGVNYGAVFTSYGVGGLAGLLLASFFYDTTGRYDTAFMIAAFFCVTAAVMAVFTRQPQESLVPGGRYRRLINPRKKQSAEKNHARELAWFSGTLGKSAQRVKASTR